MIKHKYLVKGIDSNGNLFISHCISDDIINAIQMCRDRGLSVHEIKRVCQASSLSDKEIVIHAMH